MGRGMGVLSSNKEGFTIILTPYLRDDVPITVYHRKRNHFPYKILLQR